MEKKNLKEAQKFPKQVERGAKLRRNQLEELSKLSGISYQHVTKMYRGIVKESDKAKETYEKLIRANEAYDKELEK